jgi:hypothetical protein
MAWLGTPSSGWGQRGLVMLNFSTHHKLSAYNDLLNCHTCFTHFLVSCYI